MAPRRAAKVNNFDYTKLKVNDVLCPLCRSVLIKPVTLPCNHGFCSTCFESQSSLVCPLCRVRVASWVRSARKSKKLVNEPFWRAIQNMFPSQVEAKLNRINNGQVIGVRDDSKLDNNCNRKLVVAVNTNHNNNNNNNVNREYKSIDLEARRVEIRAPQATAIASTSSNQVEINKTVDVINVMAKNNNQVSIVGTGKLLKGSVFNNLAKKEYTCRILCQDVAFKKQFPCDSVIHKKLKQIQMMTESDNSNDSIEQECLYFKPIDYRHNPPVKRFVPIKVPTRRPDIISSNIKIVPPRGHHHEISSNPYESAFARLVPLLPQPAPSPKPTSSVVRRGGRRAKAAATIAGPPLPPPQSSRNETQGCDVSSSVAPSDGSSRRHITRLIGRRRSIQEKADFELARRLQDEYNRGVKYLTRSSKRVAVKR